MLKTNRADLPILLVQGQVRHSRSSQTYLAHHRRRALYFAGHRRHHL